MNHDFERLFADLRPAEPPNGLTQRIIALIRQEAERRDARLRTVFYSATSLVSFAAMAVAGREAIAAFAQSGFADYASLVFSDAAGVLAAGRSFLFAALESFPVLPVAAALACFALLFESARRLSHNLKHDFNFNHSF